MKRYQLVFELIIIHDCHICKNSKYENCNKYKNRLGLFEGEGNLTRNRTAITILIHEFVRSSRILNFSWVYQPKMYVCMYVSTFFETLGHAPDLTVDTKFVFYVFSYCQWSYLGGVFSFFKNFQFWALGRVRNMVPGTKFKKKILLLFFANWVILNQKIQ